jgi:DMSO/TMAO reductase YedYZ molybdopterin-dependent catalytic subunit
MIKRVGAMFGRRGIPEGMEDRVPAGQYVTPKMPLMNLGFAPRVSIADWKLDVYGLVEEEFSLSWNDFRGFTPLAEEADFHCVTQWSRLKVAWEGVSASTILDWARPTPEARYVMLHCADAYTTNVDIEALRAPDVLFAYKMDGQALAPNHGYPVRLVVPVRYGWKSAKWVTGVELMANDKPGFWELNGYHMRGDPWREERFSHG